MTTTQALREDYSKYSDKDWSNYLNKIKVGQNRLNQFNNTVYSNSINSGSNARTNAFGNTQTTSDFGGDWTQGNPSFSFDTMKAQAKDLAAQNLENSRNLMGLSYEYRTKEKGFDADIRSREANQQFGFQQSLEGMRNTQQSKMQDNEYNQQRTMFDRQRQAQDDTIQSARSAANSLYFGGFSRWGAGRR